MGEHMFQNIPEFCTVIWSPWLTGHGWVLRDIRMQRSRMKRGNVTQSLSHMKFHHNSKTFFFSPLLVFAHSWPQLSFPVYLKENQSPGR